MNLTTRNGDVVQVSCVYLYDRGRPPGTILFKDLDDDSLWRLREVYSGSVSLYSTYSKSMTYVMKTRWNPVPIIRQIVSVLGATIDGDLEALWGAMRDDFVASVEDELVRIWTFLHVALAVVGLIRLDGAPGLDRKIEVVYSDERWLTRHGSDAHHPTLEVNGREADVASMIRHLEYHKVSRSALDDVIQDSIRSHDLALEALRNH